MSEIKNTIANLTKNMAKTSSGFLKTTKYSVMLANEEASLNSLYAEIGKKVHEIYEYGGSLGSFFDEKYAEILEQVRKINDIKKEIEVAKGVVICPNCERNVSATAEFCPKCGENLTHAKSESDEPTRKRESARPKNSDYSEFSSSETSFFPSQKPTPEIVEKTPEVKLEEPPAKPSYKICNTCGHKNNASEKFCTSCGRTLI